MAAGLPGYNPQEFRAIGSPPPLKLPDPSAGVEYDAKSQSAAAAGEIRATTPLRPPQPKKLQKTLKRKVSVLSPPPNKAKPVVAKTAAAAEGASASASVGEADADADIASEAESENTGAGKSKRKIRKLDSVLAAANDVYASALKGAEDKKRYAEALAKHQNAKAVLSNVSAIEGIALNPNQKKLLAQFKKTFRAHAEAPTEPQMVNDRSIKEMDDKLVAVVRENLSKKCYKDCVKALTTAIKGKRLNLIEETFKAGLKLTEDDAETFDCLMAAANSSPEIAQAILSHNPRLVFVKFRTKNLHYRLYRLAIKNSSTDLCRILIANRVDCSAKFKNQKGKVSNPICCQVDNLSLEIAKLMIEDPSIIKKFGFYMIMRAFETNRMDIADAVREKMGDFDFANNEETTKQFVNAIDNRKEDWIAFFMRCRAQNATTLQAAIAGILDEEGQEMEVLARSMIQGGVSISEALWIYIQQNPCLDIDHTEKHFELLFSPAVQLTIENFIRLGADINALVEGQTILSFLLARAFDDAVNDVMWINPWRQAVLKAILWFVSKGADLALQEDDALSAFDIAVRLANSKNVVSAILKPLVDCLENNQDALDSGLAEMIRYARQETMTRTSYIDGARYLIEKRKASPQAALNELSAGFLFGLGHDVRIVGIQFLIQKGAKAFFDEQDDAFPPVFESCLSGHFSNVSVMGELSKPEDRNYLCRDGKGLGLLSYLALSVLNFQGTDLESHLEIFKVIVAEIAKHPKAKFNYKDILGAYILFKLKGINLDDFPVFKGFLPWVNNETFHYNLLNEAYVAIKSLAGEYLDRTELVDNDKMALEDGVQDAFSAICTEFESSLFAVRSDHYLNQTQSTLLTGLTDAQIKAIEALNYENDTVALFQNVRSALPSPTFDRIKKDYLYLFDQLPEEQKKYFNSVGLKEGCWRYYLQINKTAHQAEVEQCLSQIARENLSNIQSLNYNEKVKALFNLTKAFFRFDLQEELLKGIKVYVLNRIAEETKALVSPVLTEQVSLQLQGKPQREAYVYLFGLAQGFPYREALYKLLLHIKNRMNYTGVRGIPKDYDTIEASDAEKWEKNALQQYPGAAYLPFLKKSFAEASVEKHKKFLTVQIQKEKFYLKLEQYLRVLIFAINSMRVPAAAASSSSAALSPLALNSAVNLFTQIREFMEVCASGWTDILERMAEVFLKDIKRLNLTTNSQIAAKASVESQEKGAKEREEKHFKELSSSSSEVEKQLSLNLGRERRDTIRIWAKHWRDKKNKSRQEQFRTNIEALKKNVEELRKAGRPTAVINAAIANVAVAEANAAAEAKIAHGSEIHYDFKAVEMYGSRLGIPDSESVVEDVEKWTDEMDKHFQEFFAKEYLSVPNRINQITKWINSSRNLMELFENAFKQHFLGEWRKDYYQAIERDITEAVDGVLGKVQADYTRIIKEQQSKEVIDKQLEDLIVKPVHDVTTDESGIVIKIESIRSQVLLRMDSNLLKAGLHSIIAQTILAAKKVAFVTEGRVYSAEDGRIHRWMVRDYLLKVKVLGLPEVSGLVPAVAPSASASAADAGVGLGAVVPQRVLELPIPQRPIEGHLPGGLIDVRGMPPPRQLQLPLRQQNAAVQQLRAIGGQALGMVDGLPPVPAHNPLLPLPGVFLPPFNLRPLLEVQPDEAGAPLAADPNADLAPQFQNALRRQF
jgi:hypothetical protein